MARPSADRSSDLNLTPVLNLVILLIPLLLMAQAGPLAMLETKLPAICAAACSGDGEAPLTPMLSLTAAGITVSQHQGLLGEEALVLPCEDGCTSPQAFDFAGLTEVLVDLKAARPDSTEVLLSLADNVPYEALVALMDAAREGDFPNMSLTSADVSL